MQKAHLSNVESQTTVPKFFFRLSSHLLNKQIGIPISNFEENAKQIIVVLNPNPSPIEENWADHSKHCFLKLPLKLQHG